MIFGTTFCCVIAPICSHVPSAITRSDETICCGGGGTAKNFGVVSWINSVQATGYHMPTALAALVHVIPAGDRRSGAENAQCGGEGKRDKRSVPNHGDLPFVCRHGYAPP
jgi:hypothetical protein